MSEQYVQVPVSLIKRALDAVGSIEFDERTYDELRALLSQPTPSAEPVCACGHIMDDHDLSETRECQVAVPWWPCTNATDTATPPRIADMAPGTTFWARTRDGVLSTLGRFWMVADNGWVFSTEAHHLNSDRIDPSTIRDVQPPKEPTA